MRIHLIGTALLLLAACQTTSYEGNEASPYYLVPVGSTLKLTRALTIPAERVAVLIQGGVVTDKRINQYYPHCKFELRHRRDTAQTVTPDEFEIVEVTQEIGHSVAREGVRLARVSIGIGVNIGLEGGNGGSLQAYSTRLTLRSARQPDVFRLSCGQEALAHEGEHLSIAQMRKALGGVFVLEIPGRGKPASLIPRNGGPNS